MFSLSVFLKWIYGCSGHKPALRPFQVQKGVIAERAEPAVPVTPKDFAYLKKLGVVRKPANFACSISDDRGDELLYAGMPLKQVQPRGDPNSGSEPGAQLAQQKTSTNSSVN